MDKSKHQLYIVYDEESLGERRALLRGISALDQVEQAHVFTKGKLLIERRTRKHYPGTNYGNQIGPVAVPSFAELWRVTAEEKKGIYGTKHKVLTGGAVTNQPGLEDVGDKSLLEKPAFEDGEPISWHGSARLLYEELYHSLNAKMVCDFCACDGHAATAALLNKIPYVGVTMSVSHTALLMKRLTKLAFSEMSSGASPLFQPALAELLDSSAKVAESEEEEAEKPRKRKAEKPGPAAKKAAKSSQKPAAQPKKKQSKLLDELMQLGGGGGAGDGAEEAEEDEDESDDSA